MDKQRVEGIDDVTLVTTMGSVMSTEPTDWLRCVVKKRCKEKCKGDQQDIFAIINGKPISVETGRTGKVNKSLAVK